MLEEVKEIMRFWLDKGGAAGFRCDVINVLYKTSLENGCPRLILRGGREHYLSQPGNLEILQELRHVLEDYDALQWVKRSLLRLKRHANSVINKKAD